MSDEILDFECPTCGEAVTTNIAITRCGRCGGCPPASATKPREYVSDAVKLAREVIAAASCCNSVPLARTVIAQDEELAKLRTEAEEYRASGRATKAHVRLAAEVHELRAAVAGYEREIDRIAHGNTIEGDAMCINELEVVSLRGENAKLRAALAEACAYLEREGFDETASELRRLANGE